MYLGSGVILVIISLAGCRCSGDEILMPEHHEELYYRQDTIVILDPVTGWEIKQVVNIIDTVWNSQEIK